MKAYHKLMRYRDTSVRHWNQMVESYQPARDAKPYYEDRILQQLKLLKVYSQNHDNQYLEDIEAASQLVLAAKESLGYITRELVEEIESTLAPIGREMKKINVHCVSHAHIDMNWLWGYHETVMITLDTLRTMIKLMKEDPEFTYSQSQASVYEIVEKFDPQLLEDIKHFVHEGRWELSASTWVEHDQNMANGESFVRQILYTKRYLSQLFDIDPDSLTLNYEPDGFGHNANTPEIMSQAGVKYYYHCRGLDGQLLYRWQAKSGASVIGYREPVWYGNSVTTSAFYHIPYIAKQSNLNDCLFVYGVGDHGGGPTRKDIQLIREMNEWPLMPTIQFSTYTRFFHAVEHCKDDLPVVDTELNFTLTGCLTSSSRIKMANKYSENSLVSTELVNCYSHLLLNQTYQHASIQQAWRKHMFNQFHDILPGCGINFTLEHALGNFQELLAINNVIKKNALEALADQIDTQSIPGGETAQYEVADSAGFGNSPHKVIGDIGKSYDMHLPHNGRYTGSTRVYAVFNHTHYTRRENVELLMWDYYHDIDQIRVVDSQQNPLEIHIDDRDYHQYWGHWFTKLVIDVTVPKLGYETLIITNDQDAPDLNIVPSDGRLSTYNDYVLENDAIRVVFDEITMDITSLYDKRSQTELLAGPSNFRFIKEQASHANAWIIGDYISVDDCKKEIFDRKVVDTPLYRELQFTMKLSQSSLDITYRLSRHNDFVEVNVLNQFNDISNADYVPQIQYRLDTGADVDTFTYDIPMSVHQRNRLREDVCGLTFGLAQVKDDYGVYFASDSKYGYRANEDYFALNIIRNTPGPNTNPEVDTHYTDFIIGVGTQDDAFQSAAFLNHPVDVINVQPNQEGTLPMQASIFDIETACILSSIKVSEDADNTYVLKFYETKGEASNIQVTFPQKVQEAHQINVLEENGDALSIDGNTVFTEAAPYQLVMLKVQLSR